MPAFISEATGQYPYFSHQLGYPDWTTKKVLDFGGNIGNILLDPNCRIEPENYWSIDVSQDVMDEGKRRHPKAHFVFYDRYNFEFNPTGTPDLPVPDLGERFDVILAHSVFTHASKAETLALVEQLLPLLADGGRAAFTFIDPRWTPPPEWRGETVYPDVSNLHWRVLARRDLDAELADGQTDVDALLARARNVRHTWTTLVNHDELYFDPDEDGLSVDGPPSTYCTFCTTDYMRELFPTASIREPVAPVRMHCLVLERPTQAP
jgi:2-polyprenyl-3-methyl-5-hydroxy-6-metoxy-1,4-benzoquinol methylase